MGNVVCSFLATKQKEDEIEIERPNLSICHNGRAQGVAYSTVGFVTVGILVAGVQVSLNLNT